MTIELSEYLIYVLPGTIVLVCLLFKFLYRTRNEDIILSGMNRQQREESPNELSAIRPHPSSIPPSQTNQGDARNVELDPPNLIARYLRHGSDAVAIAPVHDPCSSQALSSPSNSLYVDQPPSHLGSNTSA